MQRKAGWWIAAWLVLVVVTGFLAFGHGWRGGYGSSYGWGPMGGWHGGYHADAGRSGWRGMGPGPFGTEGAVPGPGGGGPYGMMGAHGAALPGLGGAMAYGMAGAANAMAMPWAPPDLTPEQVRTIGQLLDDPAGRARALMQQLWEAQAGLSRLYGADKRDWSAIRAASMAMLDLQRQQLDAALELQQKIDAVLTDSQRQAMARALRGS